MKMKYYLILSILIFVMGCKKDEDIDNPYDQLTYPNNNTTDTVYDPASIAGIHKNILIKKCANPGCHDGTFEPDFRTVQSSYSTLIYQNVNKLTLDSLSFFTYRVIPNDYMNSFLYERLITTTSDYMPSNSVRLSDEEIGNIRQWISNGARDVFGNMPVKPNLLPNIIGYIALNQSFVRIDSVRENGVAYNPFLVNANSTFYLPFLALDTADGSNATDPSLFSSHYIKVSLSKDNFSSASIVQGTWMSPLPVNVWQVTLNTSQWAVGTQVYFRIYVNDGLHPTDMEFPRNASLDFYKTIYSFKII